MLEESKKRAKEYNFVKRVRAIETLFIFVIDFLEKECQRSDAIISALTTLCRLKKSQDFWRKKNSFTIKFEQEKITQVIVRRSSLSTFLLIECMSTQCIFCLCNEELSTSRRL